MVWVKDWGLDKVKVLVFGKSGQVARALQQYEGTMAFSRADADLNKPAECIAIIQSTDAQAVINAAAYTNVDLAENDIDTAMRVNKDAPAAMAKACADKGVPFLHISTDYVFDGSGETPHTEMNTSNPLGIYGKSKLAGEKAIHDAGGCVAILRTSWVFSPIGKNFVTTMVKLGSERDQLSIVADQIGGPTSAQAIANALLIMTKALIIDHSKAGIYHFSGSPNVSWADFAKEIFTQAKIDCTVSEILTSAYPTLATRPLNSRLDCTKIQHVFGINQPEWRKDLREILMTINKPGF